MVAHNYGKIDKEILWETISNDIPKLQDYCSRIEKQFKTMLQECINEEEEQLNSGMKFQ